MTTRYTLEKALLYRSNNLSIMKFLAAIAVIISHAFALTDSGLDWLSRLTGDTVSMGEFAVSIFFWASGLMIAKSMERTKTAQSFFFRRCLRIFPALIVVVILCILWGGVITELSVSDYVKSSMTWRYLLNAVLVLQHSLPGVFVNNCFGDTVNGSLWTMPIEFLCYIACYIIYKLHCMKKKNILIIFGIYPFMAILGCYILRIYHLELLTSAIQPCYLFLTGILMYIYRDKIILDLRMFVGALAVTCICFWLCMPHIAMWVFLPYVFAYAAFTKLQCPRGNKLGKFSYTTYLCGWPIQQFWIWFFGGNMNVYWNICISVCCAALAGIAIHYLVEKPITVRFLFSATDGA